MTPPGELPTVLVVAPMPPPVNGMSEASRIVVEGLREGGMQVVVVDLNGGSRQHVERLMLTVRALWRVFSLGIAERPAVGYIAMAQSRFGMLRDMAFVMVLEGLGIPVVGHLHGGRLEATFMSSWWPFKRIYRLVMGRLVCLIGLDEVFAREHRNILPAISHRAVSNPVGGRVSEVSKSSDRARWLGSGPLKLVFMSTLYETKGIGEVLKAVRALIESGWEVHLDVAGDLPRGAVGISEELLRLCTDYPNAVAYHGVIGGDAKVSLFMNSHVFLLPSYYPNEGQPIALLEAMAAGLPSIVTAHRGIPRVLADGKEGKMVAARSPTAIVEAVREIYADPVVWDMMSRAAAKRGGEFNVKSYLDGVVSALMDCAALQ